MRRALGFLLVLWLLPTAAVARADNAPPTRSVSVSAVGDIMTHFIQITSAYDKACACWDMKPPFAQVKPRLAAADLAIGNLETTFPGDPKRFTPKGTVSFGAPDSLADALADAGFDVLQTANNHSADRGFVGITNTIAQLDRVAVAHTGTYVNADDRAARRVLVVERNGLRIALLAYTYGLNGAERPGGSIINIIADKTIIDDLAAARALKPDATIVMYHYGEQYERMPDRAQKKAVELAFAHGADVVLGGHPHVLQPFELKTVTDLHGETRPRLVIYSLGNFIANYRSRYSDGGVIFNFRLSKPAGGALAISDIGYVPVWVYPEKFEHGEPKFHVLEVERYLANDQPMLLPKGAYAKMKLFYDDTVAHYRKAVQQVADALAPARTSELSLPARP